MNRKYKPTYSRSVRIGLMLIAERVIPMNLKEKVALDWIRSSYKWHVEVVAPRTRAENQRDKKKRER